MDAVTGALVAAAVGWTSILAVVELPLTRVVPPDRLRLVGAATLAVVGLSALGLPVPATSSLGLMTVGLVGAAVERPLRSGVDLAHVPRTGWPGWDLPDPETAPVPSRRYADADPVSASSEPGELETDAVGFGMPSGSVPTVAMPNVKRPTAIRGSIR